MATHHKGRNLILCVDGTNDSADDDRTNVWRVHDALQHDKPEHQLTAYQTGVGTFTSRNFITKTATYVSLKLDSGFATHFETHVTKGYKWLTDHYREGDHIFLFGFSRGAHTVRCIAGMINKAGLVGRASATDEVGFPVKDRGKDDWRERDVSTDLIKQVYKLYEDESVNGIKQCTQKKKDCSVTPGNPNIPIEFVGCWDTVASVGLVRSKHPPFAASNNIIRIFRHALALDEHRARFNEHLWETKPPEPKEASWFGWIKSKIGFGPSAAQADEAKDGMVKPYENRDETDVKEVWFAGCHSDVGGGSVPTETPHQLGRVTLRWMIRELKTASSRNVLFDTKKLGDFGMTEFKSNGQSTSAAAGKTSTNSITPALRNSTSASTEKSSQSSSKAKAETGDDLDIESEIVDQLKKKPKWWIMEYLWFGKNYADADGTLMQKARWNRGQSRIVNVQPNNPADLQGGSNKPKIHYSVRRRQELMEYTPRARFYLPGRPNQPLDISKADAPDWDNAVDLIHDPIPAA